MLQLPQEAPTSLDLHAAMAALLSRTSALRPLLRRAMHRRAFAAPATTVRSEAPLSTTFPAKIEERREVSVLGLPLAAVDVLLAKGGALFDGLDDGVTGVERDAFLQLLENEVAMRGVSCDFADLDGLLRERAAPGDEHLARETLDELLAGLKGSVANL